MSGRVASDIQTRAEALVCIGMQLPLKYKENFDVSSDGPSSGVTSGVGKIT